MTVKVQDTTSGGRMAARLLGTTDATVWAGEFARTARSMYGVGLDEGWLIGWFAGAIETAKREGRVRLADSETFRTVIGQALGATSACWEHPDRAGVFQSDRCIGYLDDVIRYARDDVIPDWVLLVPPNVAGEPVERPPLRRRLRFWRTELPLRLRGWWRHHWWPARIRQLDRERADWKRWHDEAWAAVTHAGVEQQVAEQAFRDKYGHDPEPGWWVPTASVGDDE